MALSQEEMRRLRLRKKIREFASMVKNSNMAHKLGDELIDWMTDEEIPHARELLDQFGLTQRDDTLWERKER